MTQEEKLKLNSIFFNIYILCINTDFTTSSILLSKFEYWLKLVLASTNYSERKKIKDVIIKQASHLLWNKSITMQYILSSSYFIRGRRFSQVTSETNIFFYRNLRFSLWSSHCKAIVIWVVGILFVSSLIKHTESQLLRQSLIKTAQLLPIQN